MEFLSRRKLRIRKRVAIAIQEQVLILLRHGFRDVIIHVGGNSIRNKDRTFERLEILLKKYKKPLVRARKMGKVVSVVYYLG